MIAPSCKHFISALIKILTLFEIINVKFYRRANLNSLWLRDNSKNVSEAEVKQENDYKYFSNLLTGSTQSDCRLPCASLKAETKFIQSVIYGQLVKYNWVDFVPSDRIEVTQTKYMSSTLSQYLANLVDMQ